jgi:hypothetical protein
MAPIKLLRFPGTQSTRPLLADHVHAPRNRFEILFRAPGYRDAFIAGSFNQWNPRALPMIQESDETWSIPLYLFPGCYEFKIFAQGRWVETGACYIVVEFESRKLILPPDRITNPFGTQNFILWVK